MNQKTKIVSANYFDRNSEAPWLMRLCGEEIKSMQAQKMIVATGVTFTASSAAENGFGCSTVAECETAESSDEAVLIPNDAVRLRFSNGFEDDQGATVYGCAKLFLCPDRSMWAVDPVR